MTTSWSTRSIPTSTWDARTDINLLLLETGDFALLETGDFILLENSYDIQTSWNTRIIL